MVVGGGVEKPLGNTNRQVRRERQEDGAQGEVSREAGDPPGPGEEREGAFQA